MLSQQQQQQLNPQQQQQLMNQQQQQQVWLRESHVCSPRHSPEFTPSCIEEHGIL
jgi:hypothetical protein